MPPIGLTTENYAACETVPISHRELSCDVLMAFYNPQSLENHACRMTKVVSRYIGYLERF
jgi:hypothetical protein